MSGRKMNIDYAETAVLPEHLRPDRVATLDDALAEAQGRYQEYVRSLDEVPVLVDVVREPPRVQIKDFRLGQRPDSRRAPRDDAAALREQHVRDVACQYAEYAGVHAAPESEPRKAAARKKAGHKKKRAKRAKRSARSST